ncbi:helix-turn-helix transcriptional regulator [Paenibacillus sp. UNC451MF]|uniref:helix-turn-helix transcriptional regulator n=1 Tax=Paenibacillus sp. UNC451MF TaxID=1449063 RepID=UPI0006897A57|nr:AraC family transcriptional regulator [Paenibacillus sp. UNC451MF]
MQEYTLFKYNNARRTLHFSHLLRKNLFDQKRSHVHEKHYEIYFLLSGERNYFIQDRVLAAQKGDLVIINKNELHHTADRGEPGHERLLINFTDEFISLPKEDEESPVVLPFPCGSGVLKLSWEDQAAVRSLMFKMMDELKNSPVGYSMFVRALLSELLLLICRWGDRHAREADPAQPLHGKITQVARYIIKNHKENITIAMLSEQFYISPYYLCRMFKKLTGVGVVEYVQMARVREAQRLLAESDEKIIAIAGAVGYEHVGHFNRVFKKIAFITPLQYRKKVRANK